MFVAHEIEDLSFADMAAPWRVPQNTRLALRARLRGCAPSTATPKV